ncbi:MAG TPA: glycosyltransferase [Methanomassiliicoccales archaeon]|nr:glycosyltransferase [Methanomassiliicoccales archaeon]
MRIAMFTDTYLPSRDGVVTSILTTRSELQRRGHEVFVFAPDAGRDAAKEEGVCYLRSVGFRRYPGYHVPIFPTNKCEILKKLDIDVIHSQGLLFMALRSMFAGRSLKKPVVTSFHTMVTEAIQYYNFTPFPDYMASRLIWIYLRSLLQRSEAVIAPTEAIANELRGYAPRMRRIEVIPTGVDAERFNPRNDGSAIRAKYGLEDKRVVMNLGRIAREKNMELVLKGFEELRKQEDDVALMVVGEGPAREYYTKMAEDLGLGRSVVFTGFVPDDELPCYYAACDAFTIASKFETQGLVVLEAMATGKPVSGIDYRAVAEIITDGENGYLFKESASGWLESTKKALNANEALKVRARERAEQYTIHEATGRLVEVYQASIHSKRKRVGLE